MLRGICEGITDWHTHAWLSDHLGVEWGGGLDANYAHSPSNGGSIEAHSEALRRAGVTECAVVGLVSDYLGLHIPNDYISQCVQQWDGKAAGFASVDPSRSDAVAELRRAHDELGLQGVKLSPPYQNFHPHSREAFEVYATAADLGMVMMFHQGAVSHRRGVLEVAQPVLLDRVAREFPATKIVIAHMGQPWYFEVIPLMRKHENVYADISARCSRPQQLAQILLAIEDYDLLSRVLWGSDFPTFDPAAHAHGLLSLADTDPRFSRTKLEGLLYERPLSLLGL